MDTSLNTDPHKTPMTKTDLPADKEMSPAESAESAEPKRSGKLDFLLDATLVLSTLAVIVGTAFYLNTQLKRYYIPSPMEIALKENTALGEKLQDLETLAFRADEQNRLNQRHEDLQSQLYKMKETRRAKLAEIEKVEGQVFALQHQLRQADKDARNLARHQLLPGMVLGTVQTRKGQVYTNSVVRTVESNRITLRHDEGQARFELDLLVTDSLPALARYALGIDELVDMSDFQEMDPAAAKPAPSATTEKPAAPVSKVTTSYDPKPNKPILDTSSTPLKSSNATGIPSGPAPDTWDAPDAPLPL